MNLERYPSERRMHRLAVPLLLYASAAYTSPLVYHIAPGPIGAFQQLLPAAEDGVVGTIASVGRNIVLIEPAFYLCSGEDLLAYHVVVQNMTPESLEISANHVELTDGQRTFDAIGFEKLASYMEVRRYRESLARRADVLDAGSDTWLSDDWEPLLRATLDVLTWEEEVFFAEVQQIQYSILRPREIPPREADGGLVIAGHDQFGQVYAFSEPTAGVAKRVRVIVDGELHEFEFRCESAALAAPTVHEPEARPVCEALRNDCGSSAHNASPQPGSPTPDLSPGIRQLRAQREAQAFAHRLAVDKIAQIEDQTGDVDIESMCPGLSAAHRRHVKSCLAGTKSVAVSQCDRLEARERCLRQSQIIARQCSHPATRGWIRKHEASLKALAQERNSACGPP